MYVGMCDMPYMDSESEHRRVWTQNQNIANGFFFFFGIEHMHIHVQTWSTCGHVRVLKCGDMQ
jgi:hypothetical protein